MKFRLRNITFGLGKTCLMEDKLYHFQWIDITSGWRKYTLFAVYCKMKVSCLELHRQQSNKHLWFNDLKNHFQPTACLTILVENMAATALQLTRVYSRQFKMSTRRESSKMLAMIFNHFLHKNWGPKTVFRAEVYNAKPHYQWVWKEANSAWTQIQNWTNFKTRVNQQHDSSFIANMQKAKIWAPGCNLEWSTLPKLYHQ